MLQLDPLLTVLTAPLSYTCVFCCVRSQAVSAIPAATLRELIPVLSGIDPAKLTAQLKLLGGQDKETLDKMIFFLKSVSSKCGTTCLG